jgi:hypothetical protein
MENGKGCTNNAFLAPTTRFLNQRVVAEKRVVPRNAFVKYWLRGAGLGMYGSVCNCILYLPRYLGLPCPCPGPPPC